MKTFSILLAFDPNDTSGYALEQAFRLAERAPSSELHLVHVADDGSTKQELHALAERLQLYVKEKGVALGAHPGLQIGTHVRVGDPARAIAEVAAEVDAALIVLASRERTRLRSPFRAPRLARRLLEHAPCPVVVAGPKPDEPSHEPRIEPPCPDCERVRTAFAGRVQWCQRHAHRRGSSHVYSYEPELPFETHDSEVIPTGIRF